MYNEQQVIHCSFINPYLTTAQLEFVEKHTRPISHFPIMLKGAQPSDDGNLILDSSEKSQLQTLYPEISEFIKPFIGSSEFINLSERFCLWITEDNKNKALAIPAIEERVNKVKAFRLKSTKLATVEWAKKPYSFTECRYKNTLCIIIPRHSSERREYIPIGYLEAGTVVADSAFAIYDAPLWLFGILTSKMHMAWVKTVGGRLETRYRYSAQLCYNTFPFPAINEAQKAELEELAQEVLDVRDQHFDMTLGEQYNPETMPETLKEAHHRLDLAVERCYRPEPFSSDEERLECLFKLYAKMTKK